MDSIIHYGVQAKKAQTALSQASSTLKNSALAAVAQAVEENREAILAANELDIAAARENGMSEAMLDRLKLDEKRIYAIAQAVREIIALPDPVGRVLSGTVHSNGMKIEKVSVPLGVIGVIYEARPNVTYDAAALCLKSGNCAILRGGKEAIHSNMAAVKVMRETLEKTGLPADCISLIEDTSRESALALMKMNDYVDVLIPRGGAGLIRSVVENASVPVIETGVGNCHVYIDASADIDMAADIVFNAKTSRPSVCNACESLLVHKDIAEPALIAVREQLMKKNVTIIGDEAVAAILPEVVPATPDDWGREYLDYKISVKVVRDLDAAIEHINTYGTKHSEAIVTRSYENAEEFVNRIDAAAVYVNASTRFTDGGVFGFGAEIGISTQKLHARGPIGLPELNTFKYVIRGNGQVRE